MKNKSLYELGVLAQKGNEMAMLEIIDRKKRMLKKYSFGVALGTVVGAFVHNIPICICFGISIGVCIGMGIGATIKKDKSNN